MTSNSKQNLIGAAVLAFAFVSSASASELTPEQCQEFKLIAEVSLTESQQQQVTDSCKQRYNSQDGLSQCAYEEGEALRVKLMDVATTECQ
ncbi:hypothetical protein EZV61_07080 [Corallincola luteus]|uniref:Uncharacterized protein n=2 Tax=Corallincola TaxID=1775176 RepID=A0A368NNM3_9GAMM|nr:MULTISPECIES: hypothetical protein [Corallincola]RCU50901.1 hypothetical protein DU002_06130 [Corallincola holothuriorum]TCI03952.1 hypothetical protein EZV61_07080 [Corallincola luteus]